MNRFKLDLRVEMPKREEEKFEECTHCQQQHNPKDYCEGFGLDHWQPVGYEVPQVDSPYLREQLKKFKQERAKKQRGESDED